MVKRTATQIEKDYKKIKKIVETEFVTSIQQISKMTGLSPMEIKTSLSKHPRVEQAIHEKLSENKEIKKSQKKDTKKVESLSLDRNEEEENQNKTLNYVIDASITGISNLFDIISDICKTDSRIILTSITVKELVKMKEYRDRYGLDAGKILACAAEKPETFIGVQIDETLDKPDDCIVKYCIDNKDKVVLYTSDNEMAINARMYGVKTEYLKQDKNLGNVNVFGSHNVSDIKKIAGKLYITCFSSKTKSILAISNGVEYNEGVCQLNIGDDVYISTKKEDYVTFAHYRITSLYVNKNAILIYHQRIYKKDDINKLPKASYKSFVRDFMNNNQI